MSIFNSLINKITLPNKDINILEHVKSLCNNKKITIKDQDSFIKYAIFCISKYSNNKNTKEVKNIIDCLIFISEKLPFSDVQICKIIKVFDNDIELDYLDKFIQTMIKTNKIFNNNKISLDTMQNLDNIGYNIKYIDLLKKNVVSQFELDMLFFNSVNIKYILYRPNIDELNKHINDFSLFVSKHNLSLNSINLETALSKTKYDLQYLEKIIKLFSACKYIFSENDFFLIFKNKSTLCKEIIKIYESVHKINENIIIFLLEKYMYLPKNIIPIFSTKEILFTNSIIFSEDNFLKLLNIMNIIEYKKLWTDSKFKEIMIIFLSNIVYDIKIDTIKYLNNLNFKYDIIELFLEKISKYDENELFIDACKKGGYGMIYILLQNKFIIKTEHIYMLKPKITCNYKKNINSKILQLFIQYGYVIDQNAYNYLKLIGTPNLNKIIINSPNIDPYKKNCIDKLYINCEKQLSKQAKKQIKNNLLKISSTNINIDHLRFLFKTLELNKLIKNIKNFDKYIKPDKICFLNSIFNNDEMVMEYVFDTYDYKPTIFDIFKINNFERRFYLLHKFYNNLIEFDFDNNNDININNIIMEIK
jgi:hypothetical protein